MVPVLSNLHSMQAIYEIDLLSFEMEGKVHLYQTVNLPLIKFRSQIIYCYHLSLYFI